ncbi:MAG: rhodanese-like domain-containing protein [Emcibacteraceae bacterium]|nr:rhodanese-like domain-containing protein [Emcibacteraceae bacterium]
MIAKWAELLPKDKKVILYCVKGAWVSHKAATYLNDKGYDVSTLNGGIRQWKTDNKEE